MMNVDVYDTHVEMVDGRVLHFDVLLPGGAEDDALVVARRYLARRGESPRQVRLARSRFCHREAASAEVVAQLADQGYSIVVLADGTAPNV